MNTESKTQTHRHTQTRADTRGHTHTVTHGLTYREPRRHTRTLGEIETKRNARTHRSCISDTRRTLTRNENVQLLSQKYKIANTTPKTVRQKPFPSGPNTCPSGTDVSVAPTPQDSPLAARRTHIALWTPRQTPKLLIVLFLERSVICIRRMSVIAGLCVVWTCLVVKRTRLANTEMFFLHWEIQDDINVFFSSSEHAERSRARCHTERVGTHTTKPNSERAEPSRGALTDKRVHREADLNCLTTIRTTRRVNMIHEHSHLIKYQRRTESNRKKSRDASLSKDGERHWIRAVLVCVRVL